jgi:hypothetical protein
LFSWQSPQVAVEDLSKPPDDATPSSTDEDLAATGSQTAPPLPPPPACNQEENEEKILMLRKSLEAVQARLDSEVSCFTLFGSVPKWCGVVAFKNEKLGLDIFDLPTTRCCTSLVPLMNGKRSFVAKFKH